MGCCSSDNSTSPYKVPSDDIDDAPQPISKTHQVTETRPSGNGNVESNNPAPNTALPGAVSRSPEGVGSARRKLNFVNVPVDANAVPIVKSPSNANANANVAMRPAGLESRSSKRSASPVGNGNGPSTPLGVTGRKLSDTSVAAAPIAPGGPTTQTQAQLASRGSRGSRVANVSRSQLNTGSESQLNAGAESANQPTPTPTGGTPQQSQQQPPPMLRANSFEDVEKIKLAYIKSDFRVAAQEDGYYSQDDNDRVRSVAALARSQS